MAVHRAWYYDWTEDQRYAEDPAGESNLAWLCDECAKRAGDDVSWAGEDSDYEYPCWLCGRSDEEPQADDPDRRRWYWVAGPNWTTHLYLTSAQADQYRAEGFAVVSVIPPWEAGLTAEDRPEGADNPDDRPDWWLETDYEDRVCGREV